MAKNRSDGKVFEFFALKRRPIVSFDSAVDFVRQIWDEDER